jgi:hypothetical protein
MEHGMDPFGRDLHEGLEDERPVGQGRMWQGELRGFEDQLIEPEEVEVDDARTLGGDGFPTASHGMFYLEELAQEREGLEVGFQQNRGIEEVGLLDKAHRGGVQKGTNRVDSTEMGKSSDGLAEIVFTVAKVRG